MLEWLACICYCAIETSEGRPKERERMVLMVSNPFFRSRGKHETLSSIDMNIVVDLRDVGMLLSPAN